MNTVMVVGRFVEDPIKKVAADDSYAFVTFKLAEQQEYTKKDNASAVNFWECSVDGKRNPKLIDVIMQYGRKGDRVAVKGRMRMRSYEKDGVKRKLWEVVVDGFEFAGGSKREEQGDIHGDRCAPKSLTAIDVTPDDIPF